MVRILECHSRNGPEGASSLTREDNLCPQSNTDLEQSQNLLFPPPFKMEAVIYLLILITQTIHVHSRKFFIYKEAKIKNHPLTYHPE